jgi:hypothetical protein
MTEYTGFESNGYDGEVSLDFDTFEYSAPRNAHDAVLGKDRYYIIFTDDDIETVDTKLLLMNNKKWWIVTIKPIHQVQAIKRDISKIKVCLDHLLRRVFNME